jgi:hypothetical protein
MRENDLKSNKYQKTAKTKISNSDSRADETHLWPGEHRVKSSKKKKNETRRLPSPTDNVYNNRLACRNSARFKC